MTGTSRAVTASVLALGALGAATGVAHSTAHAASMAATAPVAALKVAAPARTLVAPVHYRCVVRRCGPYRCIWVNRCRRPWW
jgi:hypothetical protein